MNVILTLTRKMLHLKAPYAPGFSKAAKSVNGLWRPKWRVWIFDPRDSDRVLAVVKRFYGEHIEIEEGA